MRKGNMENKLVKRIITWIMAVTVTVSSVGSSFGTLTVYAEESVDASTTTETTTTTEKEDVTADQGPEVTVSETVKDGGTEYYVDGTEVADEATADAQGEQDHIVEELVIDESATQINHYIVDADGNYVTDENGNNIEVTDGTVIEQIDVVEKTDGTLEDVNEEDIVFVKTNEDGVKELVDADTEGAAEYVQVDNADDYADSVTINELTVTDVEGNKTKQFVDDDLAALLDNDDATEPENYALETVYTVAVKDAEGKDATVEVKASELGEDEIPETDEEGNVKFSVTENTTYSFTDKDGNSHSASGESVEVTKGTKHGNHEYYYVTITDENGSETKVELPKNTEVITTKTYSFTDKAGNTVVSITPVNKPEKDKKDGNYFVTITDENGNRTKVEVAKNTKVTTNEEYSIATTSKTTYETTLGGETYEVDSKNVKTETSYEVIDENGQVVMELTKEQYENRNVESKDYAKVEDGYVVYEEDEDGEKVEAARFTEDEWKVITKAEVTYKKVTKMYYTTDANVEYTTTTFGEKGNVLQLGDTYYKLDVKLFKNTDGIKYDTPTCTIDTTTKEAVVSVPYTLEDGTSGTFVRKVALADFGKSNYATVTIKYVPTYTTKEGFTFDVTVERTTENSVVVKTTTTTESQPVATGNSADNPIIDTRLADGKEAINTANSYSRVGHIDVRVDVDTTDLASKGVTEAKVETLTMIIGNESYIPGDGLEYRADHPGEYEFSFKVNKDSDKVVGDTLVTVLAKITYKLNGEEKTLWYQTKVYPNINDNANNICTGNTWAQLGSGMDKGFDFEISLDTINEAIEQQITTTETTQSLKMTLDMAPSLTPDEVAEIMAASVDDGVQKVDANLIKALMFVRLDGVEVEENGKTHYPKAEYSKDLAEGDVILLFSPDGYKVYGEIGKKDVSGRILEFVEEESISKIGDLEKAYLESLTDDQKESIRNLIESKVKDNIEAKKAEIATALFGEEYTEEQFDSITWTMDEEAIEAEIDNVMANLTVRWYVLKEEADGIHIDGVVVTNAFDVEVNGEVITIPEIIPDEPTPVPPTDGGGDGGSTGGGSGRSSRSADEGAVLGAKREEEGLVPEGQVLGAVRAPKTSDSSKAILWMLVMGGSALGATAILAQKKREEA